MELGGSFRGLGFFSSKGLKLWHFGGVTVLGFFSTRTHPNDYYFAAILVGFYPPKTFLWWIVTHSKNAYNFSLRFRFFGLFVSLLFVGLS